MPALKKLLNHEDEAPTSASMQNMFTRPGASTDDRRRVTQVRRLEEKLRISAMLVRVCAGSNVARHYAAEAERESVSGFAC